MSASVILRVLLLAVLVAPLACDGDGAGARPTGPAHGIAVIGSDYTSSSLALLDATRGALAVEGLLDSGSAAPGLSVALSGDVVLPSARPLGGLWLIDRYPAGVLTLVQPTDGSVERQCPVATGFAANPQDVLFWSDDKAYVSRYQANPDPHAGPAAAGDDLLVLDPGDCSTLGRVSFASLLADLGSAGLDARPGRMARAGDRLWVALGHLSRHFDAAGDALVARIDPGTDTVVGAVVTPGVANCTAVVAPDPSHVYAACSGLVQDGRAEQIARSALLAVDAADPDHPSARVLAPAADGKGGPFGFDLQVSAGRWLLAVRWGDLTTGEPDRLVALDLTAPDATPIDVHVASGAFGLGGVLADDEHHRVYVGDADPVDPRVLAFRVTADGFVADASIVSHPASGLPPRSLGLY